MATPDFKLALEKAKAIAAKLSQGSTPAIPQSNSNTVNYTNTINNGSSNGNSLKRNLDDDDSIVGNLKKMAYSNTSLIDDDGSDSPPSKQQQRSSNGNTIFKPTSIYLDGVIINGEKTLDIFVPGNKVGFVIGKGGEMIRQLQERANVKMTIIQQSSEVTEGQKQLRIVGDPSKVDFAQQLVKDLLVEKEMEMLKYNNKGRMNQNEYGGGGAQLSHNYTEIPVSPQYIGLVIGKNGENIKRISHETGAKVTVDVSKTDANGNKLCQINALNVQAVNLAANMVREILDNAMNNKRTPSIGQEEVKISVPQNKTGIVIGKGGETIRAIKQQCGCNIELEKNSKGIFNIRGPADRIQFAQQVISEKIGAAVTVLSSTIQNSQQNSATSAANYSDPYSWATAATQAQYAYPQQAASANPATGDQASMWAAYYQQYYAQMQQMPNSTAAGSVASTQPSVNSAATVAATQPQQAAAQPAATGDGQAADYSEQWAAYYRYYGMEKEAEMYEQMAKQKKAQQPSS